MNFCSIYFLFLYRHEFFQKKLEILDLVVMTAGLIVNIVLVFIDDDHQNGQYCKV